MNETGERTAWRQSLASEWQERRKLLDWKGLASCHDHVHKLMLGRDFERYRDWLTYARETHLEQLVRRRTGGASGPSRSKGGLSMLSLGCGAGGIEASLLRAGWPIGHLVCAEKDLELLRTAEQTVRAVGAPVRCEFLTFDLDEPFELGRFDVVFTCHAIHHCARPEVLVRSLNEALVPDGIVLGLDFFGPSRIQMEPAVRRIADEIFQLLPPHLRVNLAAEPPSVEDRFVLPLADEVARGDPSEAPCSAQLRSLLFTQFPVLDCRPMGGTLLRQLLARRAGNFVTPEDHCILGLLQMLERALIEGRLIESDDLFFVLGKSDRI